MATPTTPIDGLPPAALPLSDGDLLIVQQSGVTKKAPVIAIGSGGGGTGGGGSGEISDGDKGDIEVSGAGTTWMLDTTVVTAAARTVLDDATVPLMRVSLGLGNVDNTSDAAKPISSTTATALAAKANVSTTIATTAPLTGGGSLAANRTLAITPFAGSAPGSVPTSTGDPSTFLNGAGAWTAPGGGGAIADDSITNAKLVEVSTNTIKGRHTAGTGNPEDLTPANARLVLASDITPDTTKYLRDDGTWNVPAGSGGAGVTDGVKGDITVTGSGATWMFTNSVVTPAARTVLDDTSVAAMLTTLGAQPVNPNLTAISLVSTTGFYARTGAGAGTARTITGQTNKIVVTRGDGVAGDPLLDVGSDVYIVAGTDVAVTDGGSGRSTGATAYGLIAAGTTATGVQQTVAPGTAGHVLVSGGAGALPTFRAGIPTDVGVVTASTTGQGIVELADTTEATAGTDATRAVTPAGLANRVLNVQGVAGIWTGTQAAYDTIVTKSPTTLYVIT